MKILFDTNVVIDILTNRQPFCNDSINTYKKAIGRGDKIYVSTVSVADVMYITKSTFSDKKQQLQKVLNFINTLKIAKISSKDLYFAFTGTMPDFEDSLQAYCAKRYHLDYIITRNIKDFQLSPVKAITPIDFLNLI